MTPAWRLGHRPGLDAVRGVAVLLVMLGHSVAPFPLSGGATIGLGLFFALSGYLITGLLLADQDGGGIRFGRFYLRRARRLLPALSVFLSVMLVTGQVTPEQAAPVAFYYANVAKATTDLGPLSHGWSLSLEEQFYLVWPMVMLVASRLRPWLFVAAIPVLAVVVGAWPANLLGGCAVALLSHNAGRDVAPHRWLVLSAAVAVLAAFPAHVSIGVPLVAAGAPIIVAAVARQSRSWRPLERVGRVSYSAYLWHYPISLAVRPLLPWWATFAVLVPASLGVAAVSWFAIERRFLSKAPMVALPLPSSRMARVVAHEGDAWDGGGLGPARLDIEGRA